MPAKLRRYTVEKGSITVDGVSLTVAELDADGVTIALIPHTLAVTTLGTVVPGDPVNLEVDMIAKYVERLLAPEAGLTGADRARWRSTRWMTAGNRDGLDRTIFSTIPEAIEEIRRGRMVLVVDDADRENEGDFIMAAEACTPEDVNFMVTHGRGIVCLPCAAWRLDELGIPQMVTDTTDGHEAAFTVSIDFRHGTTTGTSAHDRAITAKAVTEPEVVPRDFQKPGHVFPLRAKDGGVLRRAGHTEAAVDLATMAGMFPAGVICEVMNEDGTMARMPELIRVAQEHGMTLISIADLIEYRRHREVLVQRVAEATIPTPYGEFRSFAYESLVDGRTHVALVMGDIGDGRGVLTRVHSECLTGDVFGSLAMRLRCPARSCAAS